jgi:16S rRNA (cytosine1402-N4)-methyltransferase
MRALAMKTHITVLEQEAVEALKLTDAAVVVDATMGSLGHTRRIATQLGVRGTVIGIDADQAAVDAAHAAFTKASCTTHFVTANFRTLQKQLVLLHIEKVDAILADLGWRMEQFSGNGRGFSFMVDEPLIMTFGDPKGYAFTARDIVNEWREADIVNVLKGYGEERYARRIAHGIVTAREESPIETTGALVAVIEQSVPAVYRRGRIHPATKTFQALRITVNDELDALTEFVAQSIDALRDGGRLAIITFHSIEDRIVKQLFRTYARDQKGIVVTKKPIVPGTEEIAENKRARSAKLRIFEKHAHN